MSLIYGICLPRKIYLVSDSRLTIKKADGNDEYSDDFGKWVDINPRLGVIVANSAYQASWMLRKIVPDVKEKGMSWDFSELEKYLKASLPKLAKDFYGQTHRLEDSVGFIFGGFENNKKLQIDADRMIDAMAAPVMEQGEGVSVSQTIDKEVVSAFSEVLNKAAKLGAEVSNGTLFNVDLPRPRVLAVTIRATNQGPEVIYEDAKCYDGIAFNPQHKTERVELPPGLIGNLEHRDKSNEKDEESFYEDSRHILLYTDSLIDDKGWPTVGGEVVPLCIMPDSSGIATGVYLRIKNGEQYKGGIGTDKDGKVYYYDKAGFMKPYRFIYDYLSVVDDDKMNLI
jgi:hypothetical protein